MKICRLSANRLWRDHSTREGPRVKFMKPNSWPYMGKEAIKDKNGAGREAGGIAESSMSAKPRKESVPRFQHC